MTDSEKEKWRRGEAKRILDMKRKELEKIGYEFEVFQGVLWVPPETAEEKVEREWKEGFCSGGQSSKREG